MNTFFSVCRLRVLGVSVVSAVEVNPPQSHKEHGVSYRYRLFRVVLVVKSNCFTAARKLQPYLTKHYSKTLENLRLQL